MADMMTARIRPATREDARAIAEVHVASWRDAYRGLLPDDYLDALSVDEREAQRLRAFDDTGSGFGVLVAEEAGRVIGFATFGPSRDDDPGEDVGEIPAIYVEPGVIGTGVGRALFEAATEALRGGGYRRATLWVLEANERARRFYERAGWSWDGTISRHDFDCANEPVVRYTSDL